MIIITLKSAYAYKCNLHVKNSAVEWFFVLRDVEWNKWINYPYECWLQWVFQGLNWPWYQNLDMSPSTRLICACKAEYVMGVCFTECLVQFLHDATWHLELETCCKHVMLDVISKQFYCKSSSTHAQYVALQQHFYIQDKLFTFFQPHPYNWDWNCKRWETINSNPLRPIKPSSQSTASSGTYWALLCIYAGSNPFCWAKPPSFDSSVSKICCRVHGGVSLKAQVGLSLWKSIQVWLLMESMKMKHRFWLSITGVLARIETRVLHPHHTGKLDMN